MYKNVIALSRHKESTNMQMLMREGVAINRIYRLSNILIFEILRTLCFKLKFCSNLWYKKNSYEKSTTIILFDDMVTYNYIKWLKSKNLENRIIFFFWNPVKRTKYAVEELKDLGVEVWTYSEIDASEYDLFLSTSFLSMKFYNEIKHIDPPVITHDLAFVGRDKGRSKIIEELKMREGYSDLAWNIYITADHMWEHKKNKNYNRMLSYENCIKLHMSCKAVLELTPTENSDFTMRTFDAMCMKQKLITNNINIIKAKFYNKNNIFIIDYDNDEDIVDFMDVPFVDIDELLEEYSVKNWMKKLHIL